MMSEDTESETVRSYIGRHRENVMKSELGDHTEKYKEIEKEETQMETQMKLGEIVIEKEETLAGVLSGYMTENNIELKTKIPKVGGDFRERAIELSTIFIDCLDEFRHKFEYCADAHRTIIELTPISAMLVVHLMSYGGGVLVGDYVRKKEVEEVFCSNYYKIKNFLELYSEVFAKGKSSISSVLEKLSKDDEDEK